MAARFDVLHCDSLLHLRGLDDMSLVNNHYTKEEIVKIARHPDCVAHPLLT